MLHSRQKSIIVTDVQYIWGNKKRQGHFLIQPVDVFPAYDEQPGPSTDDYIKNPGLVRLRRITLQRPIFKNNTRAVRLFIPKTPKFQTG